MTLKNGTKKRNTMYFVAYQFCAVKKGINEKNNSVILKGRFSTRRSDAVELFITRYCSIKISLSKKI